ncbi:hypothetical protein EVAR_86280_1 [Eumeta japonica]|uniref:Uncharacterized protein n=1 Tax=Eumeta variegata TaxID=151549 RepID=A0A4C1UBP6_EUMVA|nr:hypothetical protein EVAR_86280_1 [Eumeta japonica]
MMWLSGEHARHGLCSKGGYTLGLTLRCARVDTIPRHTPRSARRLASVSRVCFWLSIYSNKSKLSEFWQEGNGTHEDVCGGGGGVVDHCCDSVEGLTVVYAE